MSLAVILLNWRHERQTIRCACTISAWREIKPCLYVVDNESTEATRRALAAGLGSASLICSPLNLGYAGGNNLGIRQALSAHCQYVLLHNSDAEISEAGVTRLLARLKASPQISVLGPLMRETRNGRPHLLAGGRNIACYPRTRTPMDPSDLKMLPDYPIYAVDYVPGTILLARADTFAENGLLDEEYFFSGEIADFCKRAKDSDAGYTLILKSRRGTTADRPRRLPGKPLSICDKALHLRENELLCLLDPAGRARLCAGAGARQARQGAGHHAGLDARL